MVAFSASVWVISHSNPSQFLSLLMHVRKRWLSCWPSRGWQLLHKMWISGHVHYICLHKAATIVELTLALKPRGDVIRNPKQGYQWPPKTFNKTYIKNIKKTNTMLFFFKLLSILESLGVSLTGQLQKYRVKVIY